MTPFTPLWNFSENLPISLPAPVPCEHYSSNIHIYKSYVIQSRNLLMQGLLFFMADACRKMGFSKYWTHLSLHRLWSKMKQDQLKNCRKSTCWLGYGLLLLIIHTSQHDLRDNTDKERKTKHDQLDPAHNRRKWKWRRWRKKRRSCGNRCLCNNTAGHVGPSGRLSHQAGQFQRAKVFQTKISEQSVVRGSSEIFLCIYRKEYFLEKHCIRPTLV